MDKKDLKIIYLGTPLFAATILERLIQDEFTIIAVITAPDKPAGRGMELQSSEVKKIATKHQIPILQPEKLKNIDFLETLKSYKADLQIVVAFRMLPELVWNMPLLGTFNLHASLLPQYRGAAPINWAIINGETETGVSTFQLKHEIDTGDLMLQEIVPISITENVGSLHDKLMNVGAELVVKTLYKIIENDIERIPQANIAVEHLKHAPKIFTETCQIDWNKNTDIVYNLIRGMSPYPSAFTNLNNKKVKIFLAEKEVIETIPTPIGHFETDNRTFLKFACIDGFIHIKELQMEGKKRMFIEEFLRGAKL